MLLKAAEFQDSSRLDGRHILPIFFFKICFGFRRMSYRQLDRWLVGILVTLEFLICHMTYLSRQYSNTSHRSLLFKMTSFDSEGYFENLMSEYPPWTHVSTKLTLLNWHSGDSGFPVSLSWKLKKFKSTYLVYEIQKLCVFRLACCIWR